MCYDDKALPPDPPGAYGTARGEERVLTAADGNRFAAYSAHPSHPTGAQVLIYPDAGGLHTFYKELVLRFAQVGIEALAMDYYGRTAGLTARDESFDFWPHMHQLQLPNVFADARAAMAHLHTNAGSSRSTFIVGFCLGGSLTLYTATEPFELAGVIPFYGGLSRDMDAGKGSVLQAAQHVRYPVLGLYGGADQSIPVEQVQELDTTLDQAGIEHEIVIYPGAPHSFFDRRFAEFTQESEDAWKRVVAFITVHTSPG
jgi:carboxymethylenebutenolidase